MNPKIMKLRGELEKNKGKISDLQGRNRELEKQIRESQSHKSILGFAQFVSRQVVKHYLVLTSYILMPELL